MPAPDCRRQHTMTNGTDPALTQFIGYGSLDQWAYENGVELVFIRPGKPVENCFVESFNGRFRDECLNLHWFSSIEDARRTIEEWRFDYNYYRPHSSLGGKPPAEFAEQSGLRPTTSTSVLIAPPTGAHEEHQPC